MGYYRVWVSREVVRCPLSGPWMQKLYHGSSEAMGYYRVDCTDPLFSFSSDPVSLTTRPPFVYLQNLILRQSGLTAQERAFFQFDRLGGLGPNLKQQDRQGSSSQC